MVLEFKNGNRIIIKSITGSPQLVLGALRDTLKIEVDPSTTTLENLKSFFRKNPATDRLYLYNSPENLDAINPAERTLVGVGYNIFVSITDEEKEIPHQPGSMLPYETEEVYIVTIAQKTYAEYQLDSSPIVQGEEVKYE